MTEISQTTPTLTPHLVCRDAAAAIDFYRQAFGAEEVMRIPNPDGKLMHAAVTIDGAMLMLMDEMTDIGALSPLSLGGSPVTLHVSVPDADAAIARAEAAGATVTMPAADMFWGDRYGQVRDPFGHSWSLAHPLRETAMSEADLREAAKDALCGQPAQPVEA